MAKVQSFLLLLFLLGRCDLLWQRFSTRTGLLGGGAGDGFGGGIDDAMSGKSDQKKG